MQCTQSKRGCLQHKGARPCAQRAHLRSRRQGGGWARRLRSRRARRVAATPTRARPHATRCRRRSPRGMPPPPPPPPPPPRLPPHHAPPPGVPRGGAPPRDGCAAATGGARRAQRPRPVLLELSGAAGRTRPSAARAVAAARPGGEAGASPCQNKSSGCRCDAEKNNAEKRER